MTALGVPQWAIRMVLIVSGLAFGQAIGAQTTHLPPRPTPNESVGLAFQFGGSCGSGRVDPNRPPLIRQISFIPGDTPQSSIYRYEMSLFLVDGPSGICFLPPPVPPKYIGIGSLPEGQHYISVSRSMNGSVPLIQQFGPIWVNAEPGMQEHATGAWFDPQQGGRGVWVTRSGYRHLSVAWFTHDAQGQPSWVVASGEIDIRNSHFSAEGITTEGSGLAPGPAQLISRPWGQLRFRYLGCDRAELAWDALDPAIVDGEVNLVRLVHADSVSGCAPTIVAAAVWQ